MREDLRQVADFKKRHVAMLAVPSADSRVPSEISDLYSHLLLQRL
jgi:hypothetical protein